MPKTVLYIKSKCILYTCIYEVSLVLKEIQLFKIKSEYDLEDLLRMLVGLILFPASNCTMNQYDAGVKIRNNGFGKPFQN
jgi:hypothetical protein